MHKLVREDLPGSVVQRFAVRYRNPDLAVVLTAAPFGRASGSAIRRPRLYDGYDAFVGAAHDDRAVDRIASAAKRAAVAAAEVQ